MSFLLNIDNSCIIRDTAWKSAMYFMSGIRTCAPQNKRYPSWPSGYANLPLNLSAQVRLSGSGVPLGTGALVTEAGYRI